tara:strand:- start:90 stop:713 length:624 start_codon:yes stop_codon:yes gene_type:complete
MELELKPPGVFARFNREDLKPLYDLALKVEEDATQYKSMNTRLAGNIKKQVVFDSYYKDFVSTLLDPLLKKHVSEFNYIKQQNYLDNDCPIELTQAWMVLQEKYEFNPIHSHAGIFSFVIWLKIPYNMQDELSLPFVAESNTPSAGTFCYVMTDMLGRSHAQNLIVEDLEACAFLFPSSMLHCVYPFYTSDEYRISVAGNYQIVTVQ